MSLTDEQIINEVKAKTPITISTPLTRIRQNHSWWMACKGTLSFNGRIDVQIEIESKDTLRGFRGEALFQLKDKSGNILWSIPTSTWGVGAVIEIAASYRKEWFYDSVPFEILYLTHHIDTDFRENTDNTGWPQFVRNLTQAKYDVDKLIGGNGDGTKVNKLIEAWLGV